MMDAIEHLIEDVLAREGGYVDHAADRGGPTNWGITQGTLTAYRGQLASIDDVRRLTRDEAKRIYRRKYVEGPGFLKLADPQLVALAVDAAVNHGAGWTIRTLQRIAGVTADEILGPASITALNAMPGPLTGFLLLAARVRLYGQLIRRDHRQAAFAGGWSARAAEQIERLAQTVHGART